MNDPKMHSNKDGNRAAGQQPGQGGYNQGAPKVPNKPYDPKSNPQPKAGNVAGNKGGNKGGDWDSDKGGKSGSF